MKNKLDNAIRLRVAENVQTECDIVQEVVVLMSQPRVLGVVAAVVTQLVELLGLVVDIRGCTKCAHNVLEKKHRGDDEERRVQIMKRTWHESLKSTSPSIVSRLS